MEIHVFLNTSIECLCAVREKIDRASSLIELFKTLTKNIFKFPYSCVHTNYGHQNISLIKVFKILYCSWEQGLQIQLKSNIELYDKKI